jgi:hypothetical protein
MLCCLYSLARPALRQNDNIANRGCGSLAIPPFLKNRALLQALPHMLEIAAERLPQCCTLVHAKGACLYYQARYWRCS